MAIKRGAGAIQMTEHSILYLSGSSYKGEEHLKKHPERFPHVGILLSFHDLRQRGTTWKRLVALKDSDNE